MAFKLSLQDFRCFESLGFEFDQGITWITGDNASGKTSLLEAIYLLTRARSFRTSIRHEVVSQKAEHCIALLKFAKSDSLAMKLSSSEVLFKANQHPVKRTSELSKRLNVQFIGPHANTLVTGEPVLRRAFLDWGMFHVEPSYLPAWKNYVKALKQRNAALRSHSGDAILDSLDTQLIISGEKITDLRQRYVSELDRRFTDTLSRLTSMNDTKLSLRSGWSKGSTFEESLHKARELDKKRTFTSVGPHRSDISVTVDKALVKKYGSNGQQKLIAVSMILAQQTFLQSENKLLLIDDLVSELDITHSTNLLSYIQQENMDAVVTSTSLPKELESYVDQRFHVEHRTVESVVE